MRPPDSTSLAYDHDSQEYYTSHVLTIVPDIIASDGPQRPYNVRRGRGERENLSYYEG